MTRRSGAAGTLLLLALLGCRRHDEAAPKPAAPPRGLRVTEREILLDDVKLVDLGTLAEQAKKGVDQRFKQRGPNDFEIVPVRAALEARRGRSPRLRIALEASTPYRVVAEVMYSAGQGGVRAIDLYLPPSPSRGAIEVDTELPTALNTKPVVVFSLVADGIIVKLNARNVAPGCQHYGPGTTLPKGGGYDGQALAACVQALRALEPQVDVRDGVVAPDADVPALDVLRVANIARCGEQSCTGRRRGVPFVDQVVFGVPR